MKNGEYRLVIAGDLFPTNKNREWFENGNVEELYDEKIREIFANADFSVSNIEGALTDSEKPIKKVDPIIKATPNSVNGIAKLGVSCVTMANNHIGDFGKKGYEDTCRLLQQENIQFFGAGETADSITTHITVQAGKYKVILYTVAETMFNVPTKDRLGANLYDEYRVCKELESLKKECDYLIVLYHGGTEFYWYGSPLLRTRFHRMADNGADIIVAQHTHCIGLTEKYEDSYLLYGQGDFLFAKSVNEYKATGLLLEILFDDKGYHVKQHLLNHEGGKVLYDSKQDLRVFEERNKKFASGETFDKEYKAFCDKKLIMFLEGFRGRAIFDKIVKRTMPRKVYENYMRNRYKEKHILRVISAVQFEEYSESIIQGLWNRIEDTEV